MTELLASGVDKKDLALDIDHNPARSAHFPVLFENGDLRLYLVDGGIWDKAGDSDQLAPILSDDLPITYTRPMLYNPRAIAGIADLDSLIGLISQDSIEAYSHRLEAFYRRWAGTDSMMAASAWIKAKFESFGYDSVVFDSFTFYSSAFGLRQCRNVVVTKTGTKHPQWDIIVGGHMDAASTSPGADDNGTGTVGTLEIARVLANIDTDVTFRFITFDGEEWGLYGSWHYSNGALNRGDHIIYMLNMDMIAHYDNDTQANLYYGSEMAFSHLWADLADSLVGITATFRGSSSGSDHYPFIQNGYQATFVQEYNFSDVYHSSHDSTVYLNYEYMTRMVGASLATVYSANLLPPPVIVTDIVDAGDGQSLQVNWVPMDPERIDHFWIFYWPDGSPDIDSMMVMGTPSSALVTGLTEGQSYGFYVLAYNADGQTSAEYYTVFGTPHSIPGRLTGLKALPVKHGIEVKWHPNSELDISHYRIMRDRQLLADYVTDTVYIDNDSELGRTMHSYLAFAVDVDGHISDTVGVAAVLSKAAWLDEGRILAINRSHTSTGIYMVDETVTGEFLRQALTGFDYDYYSDTAHQEMEKLSSLSLFDMIDYELVVIGGESAQLDDLGEAAYAKERLDTLTYYLSIEGKVIVFGRWGELNFEATLPIDPGSTQGAYNQYFGITARHLVLTSSSGTDLYSDLIGGHPQISGYPDLTWDSMATVNHSAPDFTGASGIPCVDYPSLDQPGIEILYTYNSSDDVAPTEGQPMAWRNLSSDGQYVFFEMPLSFMQRGTAVAALSRAVLDFGFASASTLCPDTADVWAAPDDTVHLYLGRLAGGYQPSDIDFSSVLINDQLIPAAVAEIPYHPDLDGAALDIAVLSSQLAGAYGEILGNGLPRTYTLSWNYMSQSETMTISGNIILNGYICGDANTDHDVNVGDAVYLINFVFSSGPAPYPYLSGDVNGEGGPNVGDAVYLINYIFKSGPPPTCPE
jgi:hypothetical protein